MFIDQDGGFDNLVSVGTATDAAHAPANPWCGLFFEYSFSRAGTLWLDDLLVESTAGQVPQISLTVSDTLVREGQKVKVQVLASNPVDSDKTFTLITSGPATSGLDFDALPTAITIPNGGVQASIILNTRADADFEAPEMLNINLGTNGQTNVQLVDSSATLTIEDYVRLMHYNLLRYPSASNYASKNANLRLIFDYLQPDIIGVNELDRTNGAANADSILNGALNINATSKYARAAHVNSTLSPISNMLFYNSDKFGLARQEELSVPGERNPNIYYLYYDYPGLAITQDTIWLRVIQTHLKAGQTPSDSLQRITVADSIMAFMDRQDAENWVLMGDLNVYTSVEQAYDMLINHPSNVGLQFYDPISIPGPWHNNGAYSDYHTQSTRSIVEADGGSSGGMDDRFDFILMTDNLISGTDSAKYRSGSYQAIGQDGLRFNQTINFPTNTVVPDSIADALYQFSDHLPVTADLDITIPVTLIPVEYAWMNTIEHEGHALLQWATTYEASADHFEIFSARGDGNFSSLAKVRATGNEQGADYRFEDPNPLIPGETGFYFIRQVDLDGNFKDSEVMTVSLSDLSTVTVFPNPSSGQITVKGNFRSLHWKVFDLRSQFLLGGTIRDGREMIDLSQFEKGIYLLQLSSDGFTKRQKLILN